MNFAKPLHFKPIYQPYVWGGRRIPDLLERTDAPSEGPVAESWELSDRSDGMSWLDEGDGQLVSLQELIRNHAVEIMGPNFAGGPFPLLIKLIDAREILSVQVHPNDAAAARGFGDAKSEAWYVLDAQPGACVFRGFQQGITTADFETYVANGKVADIMVRCSVVPGDTLYIPGGMVHAIGAGCFLLEVQQNSNTTYRIFDWNRKGADGQTRPLHLEQARQVMLWDNDEAHQPAEDGRCITPYFSLEPVTIGSRPVSVVDPLRGFTVLFVEEGDVTLRYSGSECIAAKGTTWLIPACLKGVKAVRNGAENARMVLIRGVKPA